MQKINQSHDMGSSRFNIFAMALILLVTCVSCRQEICYDHFPAMDLRFSWELEWERDYGMNHRASWNPAVHRYQYDELRPSVPEWVKMIKYYDDGHIVEKFFKPEGQRFEVPANDKCSILFYNGDTEYILLSDVVSLQDARATATTRTRSGSSLKEMQEMYDVSRTTNSPDVIYSAFVKDAEGVTVHEVKNMPVKMQPLVFTYLIKYEFDEGIEYVSQARGALGGVAEGVYIRTGVTTDQTSIILFDCDINDEGCHSVVRSFGMPGFPDSYYGRSDAGTATPFTLNLELKLHSGRTENFSFDITDQMQDQPRGGVIKVSGIKVIDSGGSSSGSFDIGVSEWEDDVIEIELPVSPS